MLRARLAKYIDIHPSVKAALAEKRPIVALESTLVTHGLPLPTALHLPLRCEQILREKGVTPATIAILDGKIKVGLEEHEIERLAEVGSRRDVDKGKLWKVGRREIPMALAKGVVGGTTVSGTMAIAHMAGIKIFSTGGIGGVHRGASTTFDISSDLQALSDTPVSVVCAGSKSILDIGLTLEYLESHAVPVAALGTSEWPAFYSPRSGFNAPATLSSIHEAASVIHTSLELSIKGSPLLLAVPPPPHKASDSLQALVEQAIKESEANGIAKKGKEATPWLLSRVGQLSREQWAGENVAVDINQKLIQHNVAVGGDLAIAYQKLYNESESESESGKRVKSTFMPASSTPAAPVVGRDPKLAVVGSLAVDVSMTPATSSTTDPGLLTPHTTVPGTVSLSLGGVAGNVAGATASILPSTPSDSLQATKSDILLVSPIVDDLFGSILADGLKKQGIRTDGLIKIENSGLATPACGIVLSNTGNLITGVAAMDLVEKVEPSKILDVLEEHKDKALNLIAFDGNLSAKSIKHIVQWAQQHGISTFFEPTSNVKSLRVFEGLLAIQPSTPITFISPNIHELSTLYQYVLDTPAFEKREELKCFDTITVSHSVLSTLFPEWIVSEGVVPMSIALLSRGLFECLFIKSGPRGLIAIQLVKGETQVQAWKQYKESRKTRKNLAIFPCSLQREAVVVSYFEGLDVEESDIVSVTGAGDNLAGGILASLVSGWKTGVPDELEVIARVAQQAAVNTIKSLGAVGDHTSLKSVLERS